MEQYLLLSAIMSILILIIYFFLSWLNEKKSKSLPDSIMTVLRFLLFTTVGLMLLIALSMYG